MKVVNKALLLNDLVRIEADNEVGNVAVVAGIL